MSKPLKPFTIDYRYDNRDYCMDLEATDFEDARARLKAAYFNGQPSEIISSIPVTKPVSIMTTLSRWLKNIV